ncbi:histidine kinase [Caproiciproducens sp. LBM24188]
MKRRFLKTIKSKIRMVTILFTLFVTIFFATVSYSQFQSYARRNQIQSTEFNLQLVSGLIAQDSAALDTLSKWCSTNSQIISYLEAAEVSPSEAFLTYNRLKEEYQNNRAGSYIRRVIVMDTQHTRFLQVGSASTETLPVNVYNLNLLFPGAPKQAYAWQKIETDPYNVDPAEPKNTIPMVRPIFRPTNKEIIGYVYLAVDIRLITDQLSNYVVPPDSSLYLKLGGNTYQYAGANFTLLPKDFAKTQANSNSETLDAKTEISVLGFQHGVKKTLVSYPVRGTGMTLSNSLSEQQLAEQRNNFIRLTILICIGIIALGSLITAYLNHLINTPVAKMRKRMVLISHGDFSYDPEIEWDNELGEVGRGINQLSRNVVNLMQTRLADEKKKQELEYQMLQSQINPHFLYNTLNSIKWMATIQNATGIAEMTTALSRLLKNISKGTEKMIPLEEELSLLDDYFVIQQYRYGGAITMTKEMDDGILQNAIPRFTLQPLLENAVFHGIEPKGGAGHIEVKGRRREDGDVELTVTDDGVGMDAESIQKIFDGDGDAPSGMFRQVGILNVHKRIQYEFGEHYGITITSEPGIYTKTAILLPWRPLPETGSEGGSRK